MVISKIEAARKRETRGDILYTLYMSQSRPIPASSIELAMLPENANIGSELVPQINYLADRGYIKVIEPDSPSLNPVRGVLIRITDKGQDVIEGTISDDGIAFTDERG